MPAFSASASFWTCPYKEYWKGCQHMRPRVEGHGLGSPMAYGGEYGCTDKDNCNLGRHDDDGLTSPEKQRGS